MQERQSNYIFTTWPIRRGRTRIGQSGRAVERYIGWKGLEEMLVWLVVREGVG